MLASAGSIGSGVPGLRGASVRYPQHCQSYPARSEPVTAASPYTACDGDAKVAPMEKVRVCNGHEVWQNERGVRGWDVLKERQK